VTTPDLTVLIASAALIALIAWFFWGPRRGGYRVPVTSSGYQEAMVLVKGGYTPDQLVVQHGRPVRLLFRREESSACSEMVVIDAFKKSAVLPEGEVVTVEFLPKEAGQFDFTCQMGMYRGKVVVE
jgi:plastocyanin domain-containing protein